MELDALVEHFIADGVAFVGVVGEDCSLVEDIIDELVVVDGLDESRLILTSAHPGESVEDALEFARSLYAENSERFSLLSFNRSVKSVSPTASVYFRR